MKVYILGGPGSGKTTLATRLAARIDAPVFDLDWVLWKNGGPKSEADRQQEMGKIDARGSWIAEGIYSETASYLIERADVVLWIEVPLLVAVWRIVTRHVRRSLAGSNRYPGIRRLIRFIWRTVIRYHLGDRVTGAPLGTERRRFTARYLAKFHAKVVGPKQAEVSRWMADMERSVPGQT
ncbi:MAG: hypothetical protein HY682_09165 [Chloroflexi bacterium]|nr:hypothetical protein [Chloroflexota bacterium]